MFEVYNLQPTNKKIVCPYLHTILWNYNKMKFFLPLSHVHKIQKRHPHCFKMCIHIICILKHPLDIFSVCFLFFCAFLLFYYYYFGRIRQWKRVSATSVQRIYFIVKRRKIITAIPWYILWNYGGYSKKDKFKIQIWRNVLFCFVYLWGKFIFVS